MDREKDLQMDDIQIERERKERRENKGNQQREWLRQINRWMDRYIDRQIEIVTIISKLWKFDVSIWPRGQS